LARFLKDGEEMPTLQLWPEYGEGVGKLFEHFDTVSLS